MAPIPHTHVTGPPRQESGGWARAIMANEANFRATPARGNAPVAPNEPNSRATPTRSNTPSAPNEPNSRATPARGNAPVAPNEPNSRATPTRSNTPSAPNEPNSPGAWRSREARSTKLEMQMIQTHKKRKTKPIWAGGRAKQTQFRPFWAENEGHVGKQSQFARGLAEPGNPKHEARKPDDPNARETPNKANFTIGNLAAGSRLKLRDWKMACPGGIGAYNGCCHRLVGVAAGVLSFGRGPARFRIFPYLLW